MRDEVWGGLGTSAEGYQQRSNETCPGTYMYVCIKVWSMRYGI